jgi:hypothetical protein
MAAMDFRVLETTTDTAVALARRMRIESNAFNVDEFLLL